MVEEVIITGYFRKLTRTLTSFLLVEEGREGECKRCGKCCHLPKRCPCLTYDKDMARCKIYPFRLPQCRKYPRTEKESLVETCGYEFNGKESKPKSINSGVY